MQDYYENIYVTPIFPLNEDLDVDFDLLDCVPSGEVHISEDQELGNSLVVELSGNDSRIVFYTLSNMPFVVIFINACDRYTSLSVVGKDDQGIERFLEFSNKRSSVFIEDNVAKFPMVIEDGWQRICINLSDMFFKSFGTYYDTVSELTVDGGSRIYKLFLQQELYLDPQLPPFLRILKV